MHHVRTVDDMRRALRALIDPAVWRATINALVHLVLDPVIWVGAVVSLAVFVGTVPTIVAIVPMAFVFFGFARIAARVQRLRYNVLLDADLAEAAPLEQGGKWWARLRRYLARRTTWKEIAHHFLSPIVGFVLAPLTLVAWSLPLALIGIPVALAALPDDRSADLGFVHVHTAGSQVAAALGGVVLLLLAPWIVRGLASVDREIARALLGPSESDRLVARVDHLETSRAAVLDAVALERQRLERDLHDGAQQRIVSLAMSLGMAKEKLDDDPEQARRLLAEAHDEAKLAIAELRDFARGIHPAVLGDRGLDAALSALAARSPVPVHVQVSMYARPSATVEASAYFVVAEALTNIAKHAGARNAWVTVARQLEPRVTGDADRVVTGYPDRLVVDIRDDGRGGADTSRGTGLRGLHDRVAAVDGTFVLSSPVGGPTIIQVVLPCAS